MWKGRFAGRQESTLRSIHDGMRRSSPRPKSSSSVARKWKVALSTLSLEWTFDTETFSSSVATEGRDVTGISRISFHKGISDVISFEETCG
jgi:hypothetical protein